MKTYGMTQRRMGAQAPALFDRQTRKVCLDVQPCRFADASENGEGEGQEIDGYSWIEVYLGDAGLDYGSVKSTLIESAYSPKDEFGLLMNAMAALVARLPEEAAEVDGIARFIEMNEWRTISAAAARYVCEQAGTLLPTKD